MLLGVLTKREGMATDTKQQGQQTRTCSIKGVPNVAPRRSAVPFPSPLPSGMTLAQADERVVFDTSLAGLPMPEESLAATIGTLTRARAAFVKAANSRHPRSLCATLPAKKSSASR